MYLLYKSRDSVVVCDEWDFLSHVLSILVVLVVVVAVVAALALELIQ